MSTRMLFDFITDATLHEDDVDGQWLSVSARQVLLHLPPTVLSLVAKHGDGGPSVGASESSQGGICNPSPSATNAGCWARTGRLAQFQEELRDREAQLAADPQAAHAAQVDERVFMQTFIPRTVADCGTEDDLQERMLTGEADGAFADALRRMGIQSDGLAPKAAGLAAGADGAGGQGMAEGAEEKRAADDEPQAGTAKACAVADGGNVAADSGTAAADGDGVDVALRPAGRRAEAAVAAAAKASGGRARDGCQRLKCMVRLVRNRAHTLVACVLWALPDPIVACGARPSSMLRIKPQAELAVGDSSFVLRHASRDARKAHKALIKQQKKARRKEKVKKHVKKRAKTLSNKKKGR